MCAREAGGAADQSRNAEDGGSDRAARGAERGHRKARGRVGGEAHVPAAGWDRRRRASERVRVQPRGVREGEYAFHYQHHGRAGRWADASVRRTRHVRGGVQVRITEHAEGTRHASREPGRQLPGRAAH